MTPLDLRDHGPQTCECSAVCDAPSLVGPNGGEHWLCCRCAANGESWRRSVSVADDFCPQCKWEQVGQIGTVADCDPPELECQRCKGACDFIRSMSTAKLCCPCAGFNPEDSCGECFGRWCSRNTAELRQEREFDEGKASASPRAWNP